MLYGLSDKQLQSDKLIEEFLSDRTKSKELSLAEGAEEFTLNFDGLLPATTYYLYLLPFHKSGDGKADYVREEATTSMLDSKHDLVLEVSANAVNDFTVRLPFSDHNLKGTIDWGDGTEIRYKDLIRRVSAINIMCRAPLPMRYIFQEY